jgi:hypothetical protein
VIYSADHNHRGRSQAKLKVAKEGTVAGFAQAHRLTSNPVFMLPSGWRQRYYYRVSRILQDLCSSFVNYRISPVGILIVDEEGPCRGPAVISPPKRPAKNSVCIGSKVYGVPVEGGTLARRSNS